MGFRFRKSKKVGPLRINLSKSGVGVSAGVKGFRAGVNAKGKGYTSVTLPGLGTHHAVQRSGPKSPAQVQTIRKAHPAIPPKPTRWLPYWAIALMGCVLLPVCGIPLLMILVVAWFTEKNSPRKQAAFKVRHVYNQLQRDPPIFEATLLEQAVALDPETNLDAVVDSLMRIAGHASRTEDYQQALPILERLHQIVPNHPAASLLLAGLYNETGRTAEGLTLAKALWDHGERSHLLLQLLAGLHAQAGDARRAVVLLQAYPHLFQNEVHHLVLLAAALHADGHPDLAIETLKRAPLRKQNLDADLVEVHYHLGRLYSESGDSKRALRHFKKVYAYDATFRDVSNLITL